MAILITKSGAKYSATVTPPHSMNESWSTNSPVDFETLFDELKSLGSNHNDICDACFSTESKPTDHK